MNGVERTPVFPPPEGSDETADGEKEFVFRFPLSESGADSPVYDDPLLELIRGQLADLLDAVTLTYHGRPVRVDGFRLIQEPDKQYEILPESKARE